MTAYVEECRQEWKRLGVPALFVEEMATELESDLAEAQADGVSATEILGESDLRRFAATWATERGLVAEPAPPRKRRRWIWVVAGLVALILVAWIVTVVGLFAAASVSVQTSGSVQQPQTVESLLVPNFVGLKACRAKRIAEETPGLKVRPFSASRCDAVVVAQQPAAHTILRPRKRGHTTTVTLRLRG
ncbi:MAG TPA: hypothetical protein VGH46_07060 [Gaiellaceae bacterium]